MGLILNNKKILIAFVSVLVSFSAFGQKGLEDLKVSFAGYNKDNLREKIFVHTDKDLYLAGEIAWFKLYVVNAADNKPVDLSKLTYVEILNSDLKPVLQSKVAINKGTGNGSLYLPVSLNSGTYRLRAYTNWMKNFSAEYYFEKTITIVNTLKTLDIKTTGRHSYDVQFFPEGGNLVQNIQSRVAFKIIDEGGKGVDCKGFLIRNSNDTIKAFHPVRFGIGSFEFIPEAGSSYKTVIKLPDTTISKELPGAFKEGYVVKATNINDAQFAIRISTNVNHADLAYLLIACRQNINLAEKVVLRNGVGELLIEKSKIQEGISHITVFNENMQPECERLFFIQPRQKVILKSTTDNNEYGSRGKVKIVVTSSDETGRSVPADLSVAVYRSDDFNTTQACMIDNYIWLTSELKGTIESPGYYFSENTSGRDEAMDNLMLTHGWSRYTWQDIMQQRKPAYSFVPEYKGHIIYVKVTDKITGSPIPGVVTYLSIPSPRIQLYAATSDSNGVASFYTKDLYGSNEIVLQVENIQNSRYNLEIISPYSDKFSQRPLPVFNIPENMKDLLTDFSTGMQVQNSYYSNKLTREYIPEIDSSAFYGSPDKRYRLDDYTRFSTMEEVLREYIYEVLVRRQKEEFRLIMADGENKIFLDNPLTLFNGVPVFDPNKIMSYDPFKVNEIEVVKSRYFFGPLILNGIVNFVTYQPDPSMLSSLDAVILEYSGMQYQREFYSPLYESKERFDSHMPDFRNVLYWSPDFHTDPHGNTEVSFFTSDVKGKFIVVLQGMTAEGRVGVTTTNFEVK